MTRPMFLIVCAVAMLVTTESGPANAGKGRPSQAHVAISQGDGRSIEGKKPGTAQIKARPKTTKCAGGFDCSELTQWATTRGGAKKGPGSRAKRTP